MASSTSRINIEFLSKGDSEVNKAFKRLGGETRRLNRDFQSLSKKSLIQVKNEFNKLGAGARNSINGMQAQRNALSGLRNMADVTSIEFKQLTADIAALDAKMRTAGAGATGFKGRLKGFAKGAGAIAAGGIFGGPEGAIGGAIGLKVGGPAGAAVGAAIGAQVRMVRQQIAGLAEYSAALGLQRKALKLVIGDTNQFNKSQKFLLTTSRELAIPQDIITRQFTALTASVVGAGQSVEDAEKVFEAIAAGIRGTGGNLEDMKAAMRATSQVFSKGKVSAEELRQQLGERLPGAFTLFADSMDKTPAELDKALEQGKVTLDDFMKFAKTLFDTYGENAKILAKGPEAAGDRLKTQSAELKDAVGKSIIPIGAAFQQAFSEIAESISQSEGTLKSLEVIIKGIGAAALGTFYSVRFMTRSLIDLAAIAGNLAMGNFKKALEIARKGIEDTSKQAKEDFATIAGLFNGTFSSSNGINKIDPKQFDNRRDEGSEGGSGGGDKALNDIQKGAKAYFDTIGDFAKQTQDAVAGAFKGMEDALVKFVLTGKLNFSDLARSIISDLARITVRAALLNILSPFPFFNKVTGVNAKGNVYDAGNKISKFAYGGIISKPTIFPMQDGAGLMGEAGPEAIMPLKRGANGKLGVQASGGVGNIVVNVDASGSSVEGNSQQSAELGKMLGAVVQAELIKQKRPGGLLG
tara:strand:- start:529 stop:2610 length:2082 start_codon:yes stop_codon:yes gene_type:complete